MSEYANYPLVDEPVLLLVGHQLGDGPTSEGHIVETWSRRGCLIHLTKRTLVGDPEAPLQLYRGDATFLQHDAEECPWLEIVSFTPNDAVNVLDCLPDDLGDRHFGRRLRALTDGIGHDALWWALEHTFRIPEILYRYWDCPASLRHHHAYAGGLATHSLDMAKRVAATFNDKPYLKDLAVVVALLHDVGKIWSYNGEGLTREARYVGHEILGFKRLDRVFDRIEEGWPKIAWQLRGLLWGGRWAKSIPEVEAVRRVIRSLDGFDASMALRCQHGSTQSESPRI